MDNTIQKIKDKFSEYPNIKYDIMDNEIIVYPATEKGFSITFLKFSDKLFNVSFDNWHEEFDTEESALNCFLFGLTSNCRLEVTRRGDTAYKWTLQYLENETWKNESTTGLFSFMFWKTRSIEYLQNDLLKWA